ncbi:monovalent cation/proton antiporter, MnhE/PhaE family [Clostridium sp. D5]|nr:monovalent cation/proton antiporter, MnhE/PhaE family [Clostridium sp. D5]
MIVMFILLFVLWIILNGRITMEIVIFGAVICGALYLFLYKFMEYSPRRELKTAGCIWKIIKYMLFLVVEIMKANLAVSKLILEFDREPEPVLVKFRTNVKTQTGQTVLANSITLTPGTITTDLEEGSFIVHSLDREYAVGIHESGFVKKIRELEVMAEGEVKGDVS